MENEALVTIIIVNWNGGRVLENCLKSLQKLSYPNWELVLVDNASGDGSEKMVNNQKLTCQKSIVIRNNKNLGFALANNQGAEKSSGKYILLLNNDTEVTPGFLGILVDKMEENPALGVIQPKILLMDKRDYMDNAGSFLTKTGFLEHWGFMDKDGDQYNKEKLIFSAKGACMLCRKEVIDKVGLFDDDFVSYMEETDFCWRVWLLGYRVIYYPKAEIYHKVGFTSKKQSQVVVNYHSFKNRLASMIKNFEPINLIKIGGMHIVLIIGLAFYYLLKLQISKSLMIWKALWWNFINLSKLLQKRAKVQELRKKSDKEIFPYIMHQTKWQEMFSHFAKVEANFK